MESRDGIHWSLKGLIALDCRDDNEKGIVKASIILMLLTCGQSQLCSRMVMG
ncbi:hypothetical protein GARC_2959 [Paraglaciecola arctica BSs20135]|uniref:Uncharacterized protein n=1 Tax=Paraglaciecola arctica BSs20135 TaxID=493475 RepID=K6YP27_9ALTE|nr:hypothetical protein GARC_2959 [Paraglaciecola arctica BSs20135]